MAEYRDLQDEFHAAGAHLAALAVDEPARSEKVRKQYEFSFPILCDSRREVVRAWNLYNAEERGGIAEPATFIIGPGRCVLLASKEGTMTRAPAAEVAAFLRDGARPGQAGPGKIRQRVLLPTLPQLLRTTWDHIELAVRRRKK